MDDALWEISSGVWNTGHRTRSLKSEKRKAKSESNYGLPVKGSKRPESESEKGKKSAFLVGWLVGPTLKGKEKIMTEEKKDVLPLYTIELGTDNPFASRGNTGYIVTTVDIGFAKTPTTVDGTAYRGSRHEIAWFRPRVADHGGDLAALEAEIQKAYGANATLQALIDAGVTQLATRVPYKGIAEGHPAEEGLKRCQEAAASYEIGVKANRTPGNVKAKVQKLTDLEAEAASLGMTMEQIIDMARAAKAQIAKA